MVSVKPLHAMESRKVTLPKVDWAFLKEMRETREMHGGSDSNLIAQCVHEKRLSVWAAREKAKKTGSCAA